MPKLSTRAKQGQSDLTVPNRNRQEFATRLRAALPGKMKLNEAALKIGISLSGLKKWLAATSEPGLPYIQRISEATGVSIEWLVTGESQTVADCAAEQRRLEALLEAADDLANKGNKDAQNSLREIRELIELNKSHTGTIKQVNEALKLVRNSDGIGNGLVVAPSVLDDFVMIPRFDIQASAGPGTFSDRENVLDYMAFREEWVRRELRVDPSKLVLIRTVGDSMEPAIRSGDLLLVDTGIAQFVDDAIYVVVLDGALMVKRIQRFFGGAVAVRSDNQAYVEQTLSPEEAEAVSVAGRVRWIGRLI